jgi:hypothetical protein
MNKVAVQRKTLIIVAGIVLLCIVLMIVIIPSVLHDTFPGAIPKLTARGILVLMIFHLPVLSGFLYAIRVNKRGGQVTRGVYISLGIVLLLLGFLFSGYALQFLTHRNILFVSILMFIIVFCDLVAGIITFTALLLKSKEKRSFLSTTPSWLLATLTFFGTLILIFTFPNGKEIIAYIIYDLVTATCCFFIVRENPRSIWYVPIICNLLFILSALAEPGFWTTTSWWGIVCSGWMLSIVVSIIGVRMGRRKAISENP